ncbi:DUF1642 domain-containing protein [Enterococcus faecalis]|jgi:hypothetical protein|nr:DUF1642 domain-containing protein [Enterococcus faecalis]
MNKQELIEEIKKDRELIKRYAENENYSAFYNGMETAYSAAIGLAKRLDEPKKVVVPQIVADWIKYAKRQGYGLMQSYDPIYMSYPINDGLDKWIDDNEETFAHAWIDGYEVEKEPRYVISVPNDSIHKHYLARFTNNKFEKPVFRHIGEEDPLFFKDKAKAAVIADWVKGTVEQWEEQR